MTTFTTEDRMQAEKVEDITLDAEDACVEFCDENDLEFTEHEVWLFTEAFNQGQEAMKAKILTMLGEFK